DFQLPGRSPILARSGVAATSHPLASSTALRVLQQGGNAVDAALAASAVLCVVEPHMTGLGGDCFAIIAEPDGALHGYNGSGRAAKGAMLDYFQQQGISAISEDSIHAVTVPGAVKAWECISASHGSWGLDRVLSFAIDYAEQGYGVAPRVAKDWALLADDLAKDRGAAQHYLPDGRAPLWGEVHHAPALASTLRQIAEYGSDVFYRGAIGEEIVALVRSYGGLLSEEDLANVSCDAIAPVFANYREVEVAELPPNGQGIAALTLLKILEQFDMAVLDPHGVERHHLQLEAGRLAYAMRDAHIADPDHMQQAVERLIGDDFARQLAASISQSGRNGALPSLVPSQSDTIYLSVADRDGRMVSFINSVYRGFGARRCTVRSGVMMQNRGSCFVLEPGHANCIDGGKRPLHTIIPAMAFRDGLPWLSFGVMGGAYQAQGHAQVIANLVDYGMDVQDALDMPRLFWNENGDIMAERGLAKSVFEGLAGKGHVMDWAKSPHGGGQIVEFDRAHGIYRAASDFRKDGQAVGY
ncbi:MAG: gamma-glutamyltransferase, partial [Cohaesibacter sp.]|nr:gamma-glutamyltransferase [Cohaesibacter sp.]